jgi:hypothetical protein
MGELECERGKLGMIRQEEKGMSDLEWGEGRRGMMLWVGGGKVGT